MQITIRKLYDHLGVHSGAGAGTPYQTFYFHHQRAHRPGRHYL